VNSQVRWMGYRNTWPEAQMVRIALAWLANMGSARTCNDFGALEVLIGMNVAGRESKVEADEPENKVDSSPHGV